MPATHGLPTPKWEYVNPELAIEYLTHNTHNRPFAPNQIQKLKRDLKEGRYMPNHQGIAFAGDGVLLDGQNRLKAIEESGVGAWMLVSRGWSRDTGESIDAIKQRSFIDIGVLGGRNITNVSAATLSGMFTRSSNGTMSRLTLLDFEERYRESIKFAGTVLPGSNNQAALKGISTGQTRGIIARAHACGVDPGRLIEFACILREGLGVNGGISPEDNAALLLRQVLINPNVKRGRSILYNRAARALRAFVDREPLKKLYEAGEELFPIPGEPQAV